MVQYNKNIKNNKKGFTLVELMVVLAITAILAALVGGGLIAYTRLARFEKNEANARTLFQTAQISLTRMETAGELDAFRRQVMEEGDTGDHFQNDVTVTDADGNTLVSRTKTELNQNVAALYYDRTGAATGNHNALVERLLGDYIYDASLLNASICVEIDVQSGQVYSVFYDTKSDKLRFNQDGATNIYDRSYDHRRNDTLVGYYSAEDRVNVVQLVQTKLKVKNPRLTNGETLTLSWSGNSSLGDLDTSYTATAYDAKDTGKTKPLFAITIKRDTAGAADDNKQVITEMPVVIYQYDDEGQQTGTEEKKLYFPLSYNKGSFVLTLDAMADAALLREPVQHHPPAERPEGHLHCHARRAAGKLQRHLHSQQRGNDERGKHPAGQGRHGERGRPEIFPPSVQPALVCRLGHHRQGHLHADPPGQQQHRPELDGRRRHGLLRRGRMACGQGAVPQ